MIAIGRIWVITEGIQHRESYVYKQLGIRALGVPTIAVVYTYNENSVTIASIRFSDA